jgi:hypothetical protein
MAKVSQCCQTFIRQQSHIAATTTITTIRTATRDELLPAKASRAVAARAGTYRDVSTIDHLGIIGVHSRLVWVSSNW